MAAPRAAGAVSARAAASVSDGTAVGHRVQLARVLPLLGSRRVDEIAPTDVAELVARLRAAGRKRETIIGARVGQRSLSVTADTYTHVLLDDRELDHARLVSRLTR